MKNRIEQLDSIRGLAASTVFISHLPLTSLAVPLVLTNLFKAIGLTNGHGAVMVFFVLSGFVLSIPFLQKRGIEYKSYLIKRIFRIYIPYVVAIFFAIILSQVFLYFKINGVSELSDKFWKTPLNLNIFIEHIYLIGNIHSDSFNGVIWSLIHELRISLIFPFVVLLVRRFDWKVSILLCFLLSCISGINNLLHLQNSNGYLITYFDTINYLSIFFLGSILAKHRSEVIRYFQSLTLIFKIILLIFSILAYNCSGLVTSYLYHVTGFSIISAYSLIIIEYGMALGAIGFLIIAMGSSKIEEILMKKPISFLGKISYSLYLYHLPIILSCIYLLYGKIPLWLICIIAVVLSITMSSLAWYFIEVPFNKFGRNLASKVRAKQLDLIEHKNSEVYNFK